MKFVGTLEELKQWVVACGVGGDWREIANGYQLRSRDGAILNWFRRTGTLQYQGFPEAVVKLRAAMGNGPRPVLTQLKLDLGPDEEMGEDLRDDGVIRPRGPSSQNRPYSRSRNTA